MEKRLRTLFLLTAEFFVFAVLTFMCMKCYVQMRTMIWAINLVLCFTTLIIITLMIYYRSIKYSELKQEMKTNVAQKS